MGIEKIGVVTNPTSGKNEKHPEIRIGIDNLLRRLDFGEQIITHAIKDVEPALEKFLQDKVDALLVCGGDGTQGIITSFSLKLHREKGYDLPPTYPLNAGSGNFIANALGAKGNPVKTVRELYKKRKNNLETRTIQTLELEFKENNPLGYKGPMHCYIALFGSSFYNFYNLYNENGRNFRKFVKMVSRLAPGAVVNSEYFQQVWGSSAFDVRVDRQAVWKEHTPGMMLSSVEISAFGLKPFEVEPGKINYVGSRLSRFEGLARFFATFATRPSGNNILNLQAEEVYIDAAKDREAPKGAVFDGDPRDYNGPVTIRPGPELQVLVLK